jgi:hypothetical protein
MDEERAVVDRIEDGGLAVLLVGSTETEIVVPLSELPPGTGAGSILRVQTEAGRIVSARFDAEDQQATRERIEEKQRRLRQRGRGL